MTGTQTQTQKETHPFGAFIPNKPKYLLLGSFTTKPFDGYEWFYANGRNQFWPILESVYKRTLNTKNDQQKLFFDLGMAITDIILKCIRTNNSNLDKNLKILEFNGKLIRKILKNNSLKTIYFTSRFVENLYRKNFRSLIAKYPAVKMVTLPSPSPRYAMLTKNAKVTIYKKLMPELHQTLNKSAE